MDKRSKLLAVLFTIMGVFSLLSFSISLTSYQKEDNNVLSLAENFLYEVRTDGNAQSYVQKLETLSKKELKLALQSDDEKTAFWLNIYNSFVQYLLKNNPELYENRSSFFSDELFTIAGKEMSLDDVEHGMLRHSKIKVSYGYLNKPFPGNFEKQFRVNKVDWRIHFALNCGAKSCPPIAFYEADQINQQLRTAATVYLEQNVQYVKEDNIVVVPRVMDWFRADFGGKKGVVEILKDYLIIPRKADPSVTYNDYNWKLSLNNYK